ncbi:MAG: hypothetical protein RQ885_07230 [Desulfurococcales archaeon]|jgi:hypothetical protein|nr:hypothetical protein [Desulfurococcales archaeon]
MIEVSQALELSFYLGLLNYVLGNLLLGSPIPFPSVKRLGLYMIKDALVIWILASSFTIILNVIEYIRGVVGLSWESLHKWLNLLLVNVTGYLGIIKILSGMLGNLSTFLSPILSRITSLLSTSLISLVALQLLSIVISTKYSELLAIGILIYALPLGIFKRAGSILIAFTIVFSIALPAMPLFVTAIYPASPKIANSKAFPQIEVKDLTGGALGDSLLLIYQSPETLPGSEIAAILVNDQGQVAINGTPGLPVNRVYYFSLEMFGWRLYSSTSITLGSECVFKNCSYVITIDGVLVSDSPYILIHTPPTLTQYIVYKDPGRGYMKLTLSLSSPSIFIVTVPYYTAIKYVSIDGNTTSWDDRRSWSWAGIEGYNYYKLLDPGLHVLEIQYVKGMSARPLLSQFYRVDSGEIEEMISNAVVLLFLTTVFPVVYITLLTMATYTLARILEKGAR